MTFGQYVRTGIRDMFTGYFALVMATGITSIAAFLHGMHKISLTLFWFNVLFFLVLLGFFLSRLLLDTTRVKEDISDYQKGPGFFTLVAAACILGNQLILFFQQQLLAEILLALAIATWAIIVYSFFTLLTTGHNKPTLESGISGTWLVSIVSTQAIAILTVLVAANKQAQLQQFLLFASLAMFLIGCMLYIFIMLLIFYRLSFFALTPHELGAPYWINMGATAITALAGSQLIEHADQMKILLEILPFIKGFTLFFWSWGTWWIPLLLILGCWRHLRVRIPFPTTAEGYHPSYWGMVFPLGMYSVCTFRLVEAIHVDFLMTLSVAFVYVAIFAWAAIFMGLLRNLAKSISSPKS